MLNRIREDIKTAFAKDPAARSHIEVLLCYPGLHAIWMHRVAHFLWTKQWYFLGLMYHGVLLGGTSKEKKKRHPTIGNGVEIGATAIVLGAIHVGDNARIGAGSVVIRDVPAGATVIGVPGRIGIGYSLKDVNDLEHGKLPDPIAEAIRFVIKQQEKLESRIKELESMRGISGLIDEYLDKKKSEILDEFPSPRPDSGNSNGV